MARTALRTIKDNKKRLIDYYRLRRTQKRAVSWDDILKALVISEEATLERNDCVQRYSVPISCLQNRTYSLRSAKLAMALLQPDIRFASNRIFFPSDFNLLIEKSMSFPPTISKGVSYPSSLRRDMSETMMVSENVWIIDLFALGRYYCDQIGREDSFCVIDATIYEGWNRFTQEELQLIVTALPSVNPGEALVYRFLDTLYRPKYANIRKNSRIRGMYLKAMARVCKLPEVIDARKLVVSKPFIDALNRIFEKRKASDSFSYLTESYFRSFSPFVYAEQYSLSDLYGITGSVGPFREDLQLSANVANIYRTLGEIPMPRFWYTRPGKFPSLTFSADQYEISTFINEDRNKIYKLFLLENLLKLKKLNYDSYLDKGDYYLCQAVIEFIREVEKGYQDLGSVCKA